MGAFRRRCCAVQSLRSALHREAVGAQTPVIRPRPEPFSWRQRPPAPGARAAPSSFSPMMDEHPAGQRSPAPLWAGHDAIGLVTAPGSKSSTYSWTTVAETLAATTVGSVAGASQVR